MEVSTYSENCITCNFHISCNINQSFSCKNCNGNVHILCLKVQIPSELLGDVFFNYVCKDCSPLKREELVRQKMSWLNVVTLVLYNLREHSLEFSRNGFFHWKLHICNLIEKNWVSFFGHNAKKKKTWIGTVSGTLSHYSPQYFFSGQKILNESGWWKLSHWYTPAELSQKYGKPGMQISQQPFMSIAETEKGLADDIKDEIFDCHANRSNSPCATSSRQSLVDDQESDSQSGSSSSAQHVHSTHPNVMYSRAYVQPSATLSECLFADDEENEDKSLLDIDVDSNDKDYSIKVDLFERAHQKNVAIKSSYRDPLDGELRQVADLFLQTHSSPMPSMSSCSTLAVKDEEEIEEETLPQPEKSLFTQRVKKSLLDHFEENLTCRIKGLGGVPMSEYMEAKLLNTLRRRIQVPKAAFSPITSVPPSALRLFRKLTIRKMKRERGLPLFDLDRLLGKSKEKASASWQHVNVFLNMYNAPRAERILDRYKFANHLTVARSSTMSRPTFLSHLIMRGWDHFCFKSPYTNRMLKPLIRREHTCRPMWVRLMVELVETVRTNDPRAFQDVSQYRVSPVEYSYIRPWHIPAINTLAREFFWPGIDLSDCLQYPDFTCVVMYRRLIVAFAVMVPDVAHNETYISFLFTRPEWRKAGIATFMLYHLIQTCMGKDLTLHVSVTNPAIFLYQKFGFKVEEFVQDFYEMYLPIDSRECKHALFLRLCR